MPNSPNHSAPKPHPSGSEAGTREAHFDGVWAEYPVPAHGYDLRTTFTSGQAFRWNETGDGWEGIVGRTWVRLKQDKTHTRILTREGTAGVSKIRLYLRLDEDWKTILRSFPKDEPLQKAVQDCQGLRLLRQDPWECLASFLLSSTKQIVQIRQIVASLCARFGDPVVIPPGMEPAFSFPSPARLAEQSESELRACKMGFRARYLLETARLVDSGSCDLRAIGALSLPQARDRLTSLPGVGPKIADCVLLFAYGFRRAFPIDVWVRRGLEELYFGGKNVPLRELCQFSETRFGAHSGYAQQYLFHWLRTKAGERQVRAFQNGTPPAE